MAEESSQVGMGLKCVNLMADSMVNFDRSISDELITNVSVIVGLCWKSCKHVGKGVRGRGRRQVRDLSDQFN